MHRASTLWILATVVLAGSAAAADRKQVTQLEMQNIASAEELCYLDYGRLTTIENLDDSFSTGVNPSYQRINDGGGALILNPDEGVPFRQTLSPPFSGGGFPYLTISSGHQYEDANGDYDEGTPLDPWGNPYYFYSPLGLIEPKTGTLSQRYYGDQFDFYTIVSHGSDGRMGGGDDLFEQIYLQVTWTTVSSAKVETSAKSVTPQLTVRGYSLGASQGSGAVLADGSEVAGSVVSWSATQVVMDLATIPVDGTAISVRTDNGTVTREVEVQIIEEPLAVRLWSIYP